MKTSQYTSISIFTHAIITIYIRSNSKFFKLLCLDSEPEWFAFMKVLCLLTFVKALEPSVDDKTSLFNFEFIFIFSQPLPLLTTSKVDLQAAKKELHENNMSDVEMSPPSENVGISEDDEDDDLEEEKGNAFRLVLPKFLFYHDLLNSLCFMKQKLMAYFLPSHQISH